MSRVALISDIHGNLHALEAVLADIDLHGIDRIFCLGDVVGYGPYPGECLELVRDRCEACVRGNHEEAVLQPSQAISFNAQARAALDFTSARLQPYQFEIIKDMPCWASIGQEIVCVHDAPVPVADCGYVRSTTVAARVLSSMSDTWCLVGHTHIPAIFALHDGAGESGVCRVVPFPNHSVELKPNTRYLLNPGSVGQPRDGDWRASWAVLDIERASFSLKRVAYEVAEVQSAIDSVGLPTVLGSRLRIGA